MINKSVDAAVATGGPATPGETRARRTVYQILKDDVLFLASPVIALSYMALFPFIGLAMLARTLRQAPRDRAASD